VTGTRNGRREGFVPNVISCEVRRGRTLTCIATSWSREIQACARYCWSQIAPAQIQDDSPSYFRTSRGAAELSLVLAPKTFRCPESEHGPNFRDSTAPSSASRQSGRITILLALSAVRFGSYALFGTFAPTRRNFSTEGNLNSVSIAMNRSICVGLTSGMETTAVDCPGEPSECGTKSIPPYVSGQVGMVLTIHRDSLVTRRKGADALVYSIYLYALLSLLSIYPIRKASFLAFCIYPGCIPILSFGQEQPHSLHLNSRFTNNILIPTRHNEDLNHHRSGFRLRLSRRCRPGS
jgi:hypothetical protein